MENERFNMSLRRFLKEVGITSQQEIERIVREGAAKGDGKLRVKMVLTVEGTDLRHEVDGAIDLAYSVRHPARRSQLRPDTTEAGSSIAGARRSRALQRGDGAEAPTWPSIKTQKQR